MMRLDDKMLLRHVITCLIRHDQNHRVVITDMIMREFVQYSLTFFKSIVTAKSQGQHIGANDWYRNMITDPRGRNIAEIAVLGGTSLKNISNVRGSKTRDIVVEESTRSYDRLVEIVDKLAEDGNCPDLTLSIRTDDSAADLTLEESLVVINSLAMKRGQFRAGAWSSLGKQVERPLMRTLCELFSVDREYYDPPVANESKSQVDFVLIKGRPYRCEVKLSGRANPEGAKGAPAQDSSIVIADQLGTKIKKVLDETNVQWVELAAENGYRKFGEVLTRLKIDHASPQDLDCLDQILDWVLPLP